MKVVMKALPKAKSKQVKGEATTGKLTEKAVTAHTRAHEKLIKEGHSTADDVLAGLAKMTKQDQEQVWKQLLVCKQLSKA